VARATKPVSHGSVKCHFPVSSSRTQRGRPNRVSSTPSTGVGAGSASRTAARASTARCTVGQATSCARATSSTQRFCSTASASARRSRPVVRAPAGTSGIDSVNVLRGHSFSRHRHRRLHQRSSRRASPYGRSFGRVVTYCFGEVENTPHPGQAAAVASAVETCTRRVPPSTRSTRSTATPANPNNNVVACSKARGLPSRCQLTQRDSGGHEPHTRRLAAAPHRRSCPTKVGEPGNQFTSSRTLALCLERQPLAGGQWAVGAPSVALGK